MKIIAVVRTIVLALLLLSNGVAQAGDAQQENPLFVEARNLWQQISASSLDNDTKAPYGKRFGDLAAEQRSLWSLAGQVDSGACTGRCNDNYNERVLTWQSNLQSFSDDARKVLDWNKPEIGIWKPFGEVSKIYGTCTQVYHCVIATQPLYDRSRMKLVSSTPQSTQLTGRLVDCDPAGHQCTGCSIAGKLPVIPCEFHLEPR